MTLWVLVVMMYMVFEMLVRSGTSIRSALRFEAMYDSMRKRAAGLHWTDAMKRDSALFVLNPQNKNDSESLFDDRDNNLIGLQTVFTGVFAVVLMILFPTLPIEIGIIALLVVSIFGWLWSYAPGMEVTSSEHYMTLWRLLKRAEQMSVVRDTHDNNVFHISNMENTGSYHAEHLVELGYVFRICYATMTMYVTAPGGDWSSKMYACHDIVACVNDAVIHASMKEKIKRLEIETRGSYWAADIIDSITEHIQYVTHTTPAERTEAEWVEWLEDSGVIPPESDKK